MASKSKTDLLVKVRYQNPLPPPPFPPRLIHIPTSPARYATYEFLNPLFDERELPFVLDGELGLPLELGKIRPGNYGDGSYWLGDRKSIAPSKADAPPVHEDDLFLLDDVATVTPGMLPSTPGGGTTLGERKRADVSWLRKTEYLSSEGAKGTGTGSSSNLAKAAAIPQEELSRERRAAKIAATFTSSQAPLSELRHPTKSHLVAQDAFVLLPDENLWANTLGLLRFGEDPGEARSESRQPRTAPRVGADPRLPRALFRPLEIPGEGERIGYFLPVDDETALAYAKRRRRSNAIEADPEAEPTFDFKYVRDYEVSARRQLEREYVVTFDEGEVLPSGEGEAPVQGPPKRAKGAYYARLDTSCNVRKRRPPKKGDKGDNSQDVAEEGYERWDGIAVKVRGMDILEDDDREDRVALENEVLLPPARLS